MDTPMEGDNKSPSQIETQDTVLDTEDTVIENQDTEIEPLDTEIVNQDTEIETQDTEVEDDHATSMEAENTIQSSSLLQPDDTEATSMEAENTIQSSLLQPDDTEGDDHQASDNSFQEHKPSVNKPRAMLSLSMSNIPLTWDEENIKAYIKEHVTTNENVIEDIKTICCEKVSKSGSSHKWVVTFKTADVFVEALTILKQVNKKVQGMKVLVDYHIPDVKSSYPQVTYERNRSRSRSPIGSLKEEQKSSNNSTEVNSEYMNCKILTIRNLPFTWSHIKVKDYIKQHTRRNPEILPDIQEIILDEEKLKNGTRFVKLIFKNASICHATKALLTSYGDKIANNKIFVQFPKQIEQLINKSPKKEENRVIIMTRVPLSWNKSNIYEYIKQHTSTEPELIKNIQFIFVETKDKSFTGTSAIRLSSEIWAKKAVTLLKKAPWDYKDGSQRLWVDLDTKKDLVIWKKDNTPDMSLMKQRERQQKVPTNTANIFNKANPSNHSSDRNRRTFQYDPATTSKDKNNTYGLSMEFLNMLNIRLPLRSKVYVGNLSKEYDDELKIRQLFGHAGFIHSVAIVGRSENLALKVEYDHPVEAVQAISMLHDQEVYGNRLVVRMDTGSQSKRYLPEGLLAFGPGLAANGLPLKGVRSNVELQSVQSMLMKKIQKLSENVEKMEDTISRMRANQRANTPNSMTSLTSTIANPVQSQLLALGSVLNPQTIQMLQLLQQNPPANLGTAMNTDQGLNPQPVAAPSNLDWELLQQNTAANLGTAVNTSQRINPQPVAAPSNLDWKLLQQNTAANLGTAVNTGQRINPQPVAAPTNLGWNTQKKASDLPRNMQPPFGVNNMQSGTNMQRGQNMQAGPNMQRGSNFQGGPRVHSGFNTQGGLKMQEGKYMQDRQIMPGGQNMQDGPSNNYESGSYRNNAGDPERSQNDSDSATVLFNYLPPSVTLDALKLKMKEVGEVKFAELTGPGRAIVVFRVPRNARTCINLFHRTKVDGQSIDVRVL